MNSSTIQGLAVALLLAFPACGGSQDGPLAADAAGSPDVASHDAPDTAEPDNGTGGPHSAPWLTPEHPGWDRASCLDCHGVEVMLPHPEGQYAPPDCAQCHGYNGAEHRDHAADPLGSCGDCHAAGAEASEHFDAFEAPDDCAVCHVHPESPHGR